MSEPAGPPLDHRDAEQRYATILTLLYAQAVPGHRWNVRECDPHHLTFDVVLGNLCHAFVVDRDAFLSWVRAHPDLTDGHGSVNHLRALTGLAPFPLPETRN